VLSNQFSPTPPDHCLTNKTFLFFSTAPAPFTSTVVQTTSMSPDATVATAAINQQTQQAATMQLMQQHQMLQAQQIQTALSNGQQLTPQQLQTLQMMMMIQRNQQLLQQQQQQLLAAQPAAATNQYMQHYQLAAAAAAAARSNTDAVVAAANANTTTNNSGEQPPAKRQAFDANQQARLLASHQFRQLHQSGGLSHMPPAQQTALYQTLYARARQQLGLPPVPVAAPTRSNMRVSIDKRNKAAGDKLFQAVDTTGRDHADEVVRRCEEISHALSARLGKGVHSNEGRFGGTDYDSPVSITQQQMIEACGDTARYLKPYQIVGVNFLMLLHRSQVGGAILADEMGLGKTAQLISYLGCIKAFDKDPGPHLVVVPASLLENWQRELRRWCPNLKSVVYYGKHRIVVRKRLNELRQKLQRGEVINDDLSDLQDPDVMAEAAASERYAEAAALEEQDADNEDPLGLGYIHESDDEFDVKKANMPENGPQGNFNAPEPPPRKWDFNAPLDAAPFHVMLTSYTLFERDSPDQRADRDFLESWRWSHLIMDEAHALKNRNAQRTTRLRRVANTSRRRIMMTGTPLQNDLLELQNLMHFLLPRVFSAQGFENFANMLQGDENEVQRLTDRMKQLLGPFVLRRLKTEVAGQLTEKKHTTEFIAMTPEQDNIYEISLQNYRDQIADNNKTATALAENGQVAVEKFMKTIGSKKINHMFTHLRKVAQHPLLVRHHYDDAKVEEIASKAFHMSLFSGNATLRRVTDELMAYSDYSLHAFCYNSGPEFFNYRLNSTHLMTSTKFRFLAELLPKLKENKSRPLIFSQWTAVLDVIEWLMDELRLPYVRLDGSTAVDERLATVDRFNHSDDVFAFLLSTRAGGQGLNLTGADTVILHDVDFNPQIDRQAEDRCHRLGQTKPVNVYRLITKNSVDQNIYDLSQKKLKLDHAVLDGITSGRGAKQKEAAQERQHMSFILHSLFAGKSDYDSMINAGPDEVDAAQRVAEAEAEAEQQKKKQQQVVEGEEEKEAVAKEVDGSGGGVKDEGEEEEDAGPAAAVEAAEVKEEASEPVAVVNGNGILAAADNEIKVDEEEEPPAAAAPAAPAMGTSFKLKIKLPQPAVPAPAEQEEHIANGDHREVNRDAQALSPAAAP
jgi:SNF2 family DNA or RNA helicase